MHNYVNIYKIYKTSPLARMVLLIVSVVLMIIGAQIAFYVGPVPYTMQNMGIVFSGLTLEPSYALTAMLCYLALIALGLPIAAGAHGGPYVLIGYTAGYLWGFPIMAFIVSHLARKYFAKVGRSLMNMTKRDFAMLLLITFIAAIPMYLMGFAVFYLYLSMGARPLYFFTLKTLSFLHLNPYSTNFVLATFVVTVLIFIPQDVFMDHVIGIALASMIMRYLKHRGLVA